MPHSLPLPPVPLPLWRARTLLPGLLVAIGLTTACGGEANGGEGTDAGPGSGGSGERLSTGEGPCDEPDECAGGVCVALIDGNNPPVYCSEECGACPDGFYCDQDTFALAGLSFCRFGATPSEPPPPPPEPPRLPCKADDDCDGGLVCATFMGERDCTIPCSAEPECSVELGGVSIDLHECASDQSDGAERLVCLPDLSCFPNATSCISFPGF